MRQRKYKPAPGDRGTINDPDGPLHGRFVEVHRVRTAGMAVRMMDDGTPPAAHAWRKGDVAYIEKYQFAQGRPS